MLTGRYMPQAVLNWRNKSTVGCNIHNFLLDFTGGTLSLAQLLLDCYVTDDWSAISGSIAKFGLRFGSLPASHSPLSPFGRSSPFFLHD